MNSNATLPPSSQAIQKNFNPTFAMWGFLITSIIIFYLYFELRFILFIVFGLFFALLFINTIEWLTVTSEGVRIRSLIKKPLFFPFREFRFEPMLRDYTRWATRNVEIFDIASGKQVHSIRLNNFMQHLVLLAYIRYAQSIARGQHLALPDQWTPSPELDEFKRDNFVFTENQITINDRVFPKNAITLVKLDYPVVFTAAPDRLASKNPHTLTIQTGAQNPPFQLPVLNELKSLSELDERLLLYFQDTPDKYVAVC
jgi:hypothetical protein